MALPQGMYLRPGRPDIDATLQNAIAGVTEMFWPRRNRNRNPTTPSGIVIGTCGSTSLIDDATRAVGRVNWSDWGEVGGVESIEECVSILIHTTLAVAGPVLNGLGFYRVFGH